MGRPVMFPERRTGLRPRLCAGIGEYLEVWRSGASRQEWNLPFDKRDKETHRFAIADTRGRMELTVPIAKPATSRCLWCDVRISDHGSWWDVHRVALESAYGRTPYFEFYIDGFLPMLTSGVMERYPMLCDLAGAWDAEIRRLLGVEPPCGGPVELCAAPQDVSAVEYRQVRQDKLGFIGGLSVLDLLFNLGPEAQLWLNGLR